MICIAMMYQNIVISINTILYHLFYRESRAQIDEYSEKSPNRMGNFRSQKYVADFSIKETPALAVSAIENLD